MKIIFAVFTACLVSAALADNFFGGACKADGTLKCTAAKELACVNSFCSCTADSAFKGEYIGNSDGTDSASAECKKTCDDTKYKCGTNGACDKTDAANPFCGCKAGYVYDVSKAKVSSQTANFDCKVIAAEADCVSAKGGAAADFKKDSNNLCSCADSTKKLTYQKTDGKYTCAAGSGGSGALGVTAVFISTAILALVAKMM